MGIAGVEKKAEKKNEGKCSKFLPAGRELWGLFGSIKNVSLDDFIIGTLPLSGRGWFMFEIGSGVITNS